MRRAVWVVAGLALLVPPPAISEENAERPATEVERVLQQRYLDRYFVLRTDIKVQEVTSRQVVSRSFPKGGLELTRPITVATPEGVFYMSDYARKEQLETDPRLGPNENSVPTEDPRGVTGQPLDAVVEISGRSRVVLHAGELARVTGISENSQGFEAMFEGFETGPATVFVRTQLDAYQPVPRRAEAFSDSLARLVFDLPDDAGEKEAWIDPGWSEEVQEAVREGHVREGMTEVQVLLAWGTPVYITRAGSSSGPVLNYKRGKNVMDQLRNRKSVAFAGGRVVSVEVASSP